MPITGRVHVRRTCRHHPTSPRRTVPPVRSRDGHARRARSASSSSTPPTRSPRPRSDRQAELRIWLAARATGIVAFLLLTFQICVGLILSHPTNKSTWKLSKRIFPWHEHVWVFVMAFLSSTSSASSSIRTPGSASPGRSSRACREYRSSPVALGTMALYAFLLTAITARYTKLLPAGRVAVDPSRRAGRLRPRMAPRRPGRHGFGRAQVHVHRGRPRRRSAPVPIATGPRASDGPRSPHRARRSPPNEHPVATDPPHADHRHRHRRARAGIRRHPRGVRLDRRARLRSSRAPPPRKPSRPSWPWNRSARPPSRRSSSPSPARPTR